jgi:hypothetical protein
MFTEDESETESHTICEKNMSNCSVLCGGEKNNLRGYGVASSNCRFMSSESRISSHATVFNIKASSESGDFFSSSTVSNSVGTFTVKELIEMNQEIFDRFYSEFLLFRKENYSSLDSGITTAIVGPVIIMADLIMNDILLHRELRKRNNLISLLQKEVEMIKFKVFGSS